MDYTVGCFDIGNDHLDVIVQQDLAVLYPDVDVLAQGSRGFGQSGHIGGQDFAGDNVIGQDVGELLLVLRQEQAVQCAGGQGGEGIVGGGEHGERTFTLQGIHQPSGLDSGHQGLEAAIGHGGIN